MVPRPHPTLPLLAFLVATVIGASTARGASVHPLFDLSSPRSSPFPSNRFTASDPGQITGVRIALPKPDCAQRPSDCADLDVLNELDGFNLVPRLSIPFDGPIDPATVSSTTVFLVNLDDAGHRVVGIDPIVWDPPTQTLHVESAEVLDQHTRYALVATKDVHDAAGKETKAAKEFVAFVDDAITASTGDPALDGYRTQLRQALDELDSKGIVSKGQVVAASVFTTLSVTASLEQIRDQIKASTPAAAEILIGSNGNRAVFPRSAMTRLVSNEQRSTDPAAQRMNVPLPLAVLDVVPGATGSIAFGRFEAPDYRVHPGEFIPQVGSLTGAPRVQGSQQITFALFLPSSAKPASGYPVAIWGHGGGGNKLISGHWAAKLAQHGIATIAIDAPGFGFGPLSTVTVTLVGPTTVIVPSGGRGIDRNADGNIEEDEGFDPAPPRAILGAGRADGHRQWAAEHMQLVRVIEVGIDVDGDGVPDLDPSRIYYGGASMGASQGTILMALDPSVRAGVLLVLGGFNGGGLSSRRQGVGLALQARVPSLVNGPGIIQVDGVAESPPFFNENKPLTDHAPYSVLLEDGSQRTIRSPQINAVAGAMEIQEVQERAQWASALGSLGFSSHLRREPLMGVPAKPLIIQIAFGDRVATNPSTTSTLRAGALADRATFYRSDLAFPAGNPTPFPADTNLYPHAFNQIVPNNLPGNAALVNRALQAKEQIATFFARDGDNHALDPFDGSQIIDPDGDEPIFEVPVVLPLPTRLNYPLSGALTATSFDSGTLTPGIASIYRDAGRAAPITARPLPYRGGTLHIVFTTAPGENGANATLSLYDLLGRRVRRIATENHPGEHIASWDGLDDRGVAVGPGIYFLRLAPGGRSAVTKIVVAP